MKREMKKAKKRTTWGQISLFLSGALLIALCACQPTPENEVVVNKGDEVYEQKISIAKKEERQESSSVTVTIEPSPTEAPAYEFEPHWRDTVSLRNFDVEIDVEVEAPNVANFPVYRVKGSQFVLEDSRLEPVFQALMGEVTAERPGGMTIQDYKERIERLQEGQYDYESKEWRPYDKETYERRAGEYTKEMQSAPDENDFSSADRVAFQELDTQKVFKGQDGTLWEVLYAENIINVSRYVRGITQPERWVTRGDAIDGELAGTTLENVSCTETEARQFTADFLEAIDIGDMDISFMEKGRILDADTSEVLKEGWIVECARKGGACSAFNYRKYDAGGNLRFTDEAYSAGLGAEGIELFVDNQGVADFTWRNPLEIIQREAATVEILPYEQAQELMRQAMVNGLSWTGNKKSGSAFSGCYVTRVILSYCFVPVKDSPEEFYYTPAWFVLMHYNEDTIAMQPFSFAINAVDGTRIDLP